MSFIDSMHASARAGALERRSIRSLLLGATILAASMVVHGIAAADNVAHQNVYNYGNVTNAALPDPYVGPTIGAAERAINLGEGASLSISATGAAASISVSSINTELPIAAAAWMTSVQQSVLNQGDVENQTWIAEQPAALVIDLGSSASAGIVGNGGSVSISATGAVASVSASKIGGANDVLPIVSAGLLPASSGVEISVSSFNPSSYPASTNSTTPATTDGQASYIGGGISQAYASNFAYSVGGINGGFAALDPGVTNTGSVTNFGSIAGIGNLGTGASASISASGAVAAVSTSGLNANFSSGGNAGPIYQASQNTGLILNDGHIAVNADTQSGSTPALDVGASMSIAATGAVASVSLSMINGDQTAAFSYGLVQQVVSNTGQGNRITSVANSGSISLSGAELGNGSSVSVSATGAVASVSTSAVSASASDQYSLFAPGISTTYTDTGSGNDGAPSLAQNQSINYQDVPYYNNVHEINTDANRPYDFVIRSQYGLSQYVLNKADITNQGVVNSIGALGVGSSTSVSASGAVTSFSIVGNNTNISSGSLDPRIVDGVHGAGYSVGPIGGITQNASNIASNINDGGDGYLVVHVVANNGEIFGNGAAMNVGASVSVSATGAVASVSFSAIASSGETIDAQFPSIIGVSDASTANAFDTAWTLYTYSEQRTDYPFGGGSYASYANGLTHTEYGTHSEQVTGVNQTSTNEANISNSGDIHGLGLMMAGSSQSISASGAVAAVSISGVNANITSPWIASINQTALNSGNIQNTNVSINGVGSSDIGIGASVAISAQGAVSSVSVASTSDAAPGGETNLYLPIYAFTDGWTTSQLWEIEYTNSPSYSDIFGYTDHIYREEYGRTSGGSTYTVNHQESANFGTITNSGSIGGEQSFGNLGMGASVSVSASGAVAAMSFTGINVQMHSSQLSDHRSDRLVQESNNFGGVTNTSGDGGISVAALGLSSSVSVSATGAVASFSLTGVQTSLNNFDFDGIEQAAGNEGNISNGGQIRLVNDSALGIASNLGISATGAVAAISITAVAGGASPLFSMPVVGVGQNVVQQAVNLANVSNSGQISGAGSLDRSSSISISATGAVTSIGVNVSGIHTDFGGVVTGDKVILQSTRNQGAITNDGSGGIVASGALSDGASISISATGAVASIGVSNVAITFSDPGNGVGDRFWLGSQLHQTAQNSGEINNAPSGGNSISSGEISGDNASLSISATGTVTSVNYATSDTAGLYNPGPGFSDIEQNSHNGFDGSGVEAAPVNNSGEIVIGGAGISGIGASVSINATGAVSSIATSSINDQTVQSGPAIFAVSQYARNDGGSNVSNFGSILIGSGSNAGLGVGASAAIATTGAAASASFRAVRAF